MKTIGIITIISFHIGAKPSAPFIRNGEGSGTNESAGIITMQESKSCVCDTTGSRMIFIPQLP